MSLDVRHVRGSREVRIVLWDMAIAALWASAITATALWAVTTGPMKRSWRGLDAHDDLARRRRP